MIDTVDKTSNVEISHCVSPFALILPASLDCFQEAVDFYFETGCG